MNVATLRVEGPAELLIEIKQLWGISSDSEWHAGERWRDGTIRDLSGFNSAIADAETMVSAISQLQAFLAKCAATAVTFPWQGVTGEVDVGFSVGDSERISGGFRLSAHDIQSLAASGLALVATAYPTSDEANAT